MPLLLTKLRPPRTRAQTVARDRLLERLDSGRDAKVTVVAAPAGCGKTTLLAMWHAAEVDTRPVAWVTLDDGDNDPLVLWAHLLEALHRVCPAIDPASSPHELVNDLTDQDDVALILDDFHRLSSGAARDSMTWFLERAPATFQLVLASRSEPALPLGRLRARGELVEVRAHELSFTSDEADRLLNDHFSLDLTRADVDGLVERTEGWPAGVYLAALSLAGVDDRQAFLGAFGGTSRHVIDFLAGEVLDAHDADMQKLMVRTSILDRLSGPLCDAVLEQEGSGPQLQELARTNLFLVPLDDQGEWFRFHRLFAQILRVELEHREPGLAPALQRRALAWHHDHRLSEDGGPEPQVLADACAAPRPSPKQRHAANRALTERERTILRMLSGSLSQSDIGRELYLSYNTVHSHTRSIYCKLGVSSRADALERARERGLI